MYTRKEHVKNCKMMEVETREVATRYYQPINEQEKSTPAMRVVPHEFLATHNQISNFSLHISAYLLLFNTSCYYSLPLPPSLLSSLPSFLPPFTYPNDSFVRDELLDRPFLNPSFIPPSSSLSTTSIPSFSSSSSSWGMYRESALKALNASRFA